MRKILAIMLCLVALKADAMMLDENGKPRTTPYTIYDVNEHCRMQGYFLIGDTLFMCAVVREGVTKEEFDKQREALAKRDHNRWADRIKRFYGK
jgi:hypothetical protein